MIIQVFNDHECIQDSRQSYTDTSTELHVHKTTLSEVRVHCVIQRGGLSTDPLGQDGQSRMCNEGNAIPPTNV